MAHGDPVAGRHGNPDLYVFTEIVESERIAYRSAPPDSDFWQGNPPPAYYSTLEFIERDGGTQLKMHTEFATEQQAQDAMRRGFAEGTRQAHDKLARLLERQSQQD